MEDDLDEKVKDKKINEDFYDELLDEDGNIIVNEKMRGYFDPEKLVAPSILKPKKNTIYNPRSLLRSATSNDCNYREKNRCMKLNKVITMDARECVWGKTKDGLACWDRMFCKEDVQLR